MRRLLPLLLLLSLACPDTTPPLRHEICGNGKDDDNNGKTDCADPACFSDPLCDVVTENCTNGIDDDRNGLLDCLDPACFSDPSCNVAEICDNGLDDNHNGLIDCAEPTCRSQPFCGDGGAEAPNHCGDGLDNDNNGFIDCKDSACVGQSCDAGCTCTDAGVKGESNCGDQLDNDGDGKVDCLDSDCEAQSCGPGCACHGGLRGEGICVDGVDNDLDGFTDCADSDCANAECAGPDGGCRCLSAKKTETNCTDGLDNDGDGATDCLDTPDCDGTACGVGCVCRAAARHETLCSDRLDNDSDGLRDCADPDCAGTPTCGSPALPETTNCGDGIDNDDNGYIDCEDSACAAHSCGVGCTCAALKATETNCSDGLDNDHDGLTDCADPDCQGVGTETSCTDGLDNNCDGRVDCADPTCTGCSALPVGAACASNAQCASGTCWTEVATGWPSGYCVAAVGACSLDAGVSAGCPVGSVCAQDHFGTLCRQQCTGSGATTCRGAYACHDENQLDVTESWCVPLCNADSDCSRLGGAYGCNPWSRRCEAKDKALARTGAACSGDGACESGWCQRGSSNGGYCSSICRKAAPACGLATNGLAGACDADGTVDATWRCFASCGGSTDCRGSPYTCRAAPWGPTSSNVCHCSVAGEPCAVAADCCSPLGQCFFGFCLF